MGAHHGGRDGRSAASPDPPPAASAVFGERLPLARAYADLLAESATLRGLIGPNEVPRLWERHLLNCAALGELIPPAAAAIDLGSGAGLPGLALAIARPDTTWWLVEPMLRRTTWLKEALDMLDLDNVRVRRGRAQDLVGDLRAEVVAARAVAPLATLAGWSVPLLEPGGVLLAIKGVSAGEELSRDAEALRSLGLRDAEVLTVGMGVLEQPSLVVRTRLSGTTR